MGAIKIEIFCAFIQFKLHMRRQMVIELRRVQGMEKNLITIEF
jgi:hypothetical protein